MDEASAAAAVPVQKAKQQQQHRLKKAPASIASHHAKTSLVALCRAVVTTNLERYPPESFGICDPDEWQAIVRLRHASTQPKRVIGAAVTGLDGTGRLVPAVAEKLLHAIEECNPHLSDCPVADTLMWKDCVEYRFRRGAGLTRPTALHLPWPLLVHELQVQANHLMTSSASPTVDIQEVINILRAAPMNVALLKDSGVGKTVKKAIKKVDAEWKTQLEDLLSVWMEMAATDGVVSSNTQTKHDDTTQEDLELAETCHSWRQLFAVLKHRNEELRTTQGKRMREIRNNVCSLRAARAMFVLRSQFLLTLGNQPSRFRSSQRLARNSSRFDPPLQLPNNNAYWTARRAAKAGMLKWHSFARRRRSRLRDKKLRWFAQRSRLATPWPLRASPKKAWLTSERRLEERSSNWVMESA